MEAVKNLRKLSFLVYGLGLTGKSVVNFFKKNRINNYYVWDDYANNLYKSKRADNLKKVLDKVDYIVLSPGVNLIKSKNKKKILKYKKKIITDLDIIYLIKNFHRSIVVTGTNGKSTTCKILAHLLKKNNFKVLVGGNIGTPILNLKIKKNNFLIIEASSFQLAYSQFICPNYAMLLNITNDHIDWHGSMKNYINSKFKIFKIQKKNHYSFLNKKLKFEFQKRKLLGKLIIPQIPTYRKLKYKIKNSYLKMDINDENMSHAFALSKLLRISEKSFVKSLDSFKGLQHRYEVFLKKKNYVFINDSKATSFQSTRFALENTKNIFWIVGGLPKKNDKINLTYTKKNIIKSYIIGKNISFFKKQIENKVNYVISKNLQDAVRQIFVDIKSLKKRHVSVLLSPASASFDQFLNFEVRGERFKSLIKNYARKYL